MARTPAPGTRERILSVATWLFYEHGVRAVGMHQVVTEAGTGKNLLYTHFPTKADLVTAYLQRAAELRFAAAQEAGERAGDDPRTRLVAVVDEVARTVQQPGFRGCAFRNYLAEFPDDTDVDADRPVPARVALDFLASTRRDLAAAVGRLHLPVPDADRLVEQLWLLVDGLYLQATYRDRTDGRLDRSAEAALGLARRLVDRSGPA